MATIPYRPFGPLKSLDFGGGPTITRSTDSRYYVDRISSSNGLFDWDYSVDAMGNPTAIDDLSTADQDRSFAYQDYAYFLTSGSGPWGSRGWTYDKIGNRRTEVRGATTDIYSYVQVGGHDTSKLSQIVIGGGGGTKTYSYNASGDGTGTVLGTSTTIYTVDDAHRMSTWALTGATGMGAAYDGRGLLSLATSPAGIKRRDESRFTFSSAGVLMQRATVQMPLPGELETLWYFSFAGLPVAQWRTTSFSHGFSIEKIIVDHLGTPVAGATGTSNNAGFEPFGVDYAGNLIGTDRIFPGQTVDSITQPATSLYYNVHRWYEPQTGRYTSADPLGLRGAMHLFGYAGSQPLSAIDPLGLAVTTIGCGSFDAAIQDAAGQADAASQTCLSCKDRRPFRDKIRNLTVKCVPYSFMLNPKTGSSDSFCGKAGGRDAAGNIVRYQRQVDLSPTGVKVLPGCPCLQSLILHEVTHLLGYTDQPSGDNSAYAAAARCFSCSPNPFMFSEDISVSP